MNRLCLLARGSPMFPPAAGRAASAHAAASGGPGQEHADKFDTIATPDATDDLPCHAVASVIRAHSLLWSLPGVDPDRTAITGISWGGYTTCIVSSLDDRFRAAVPVYGCGHLRENSRWLGESYCQELCSWDLNQAASPFSFPSTGHNFRS